MKKRPQTPLVIPVMTVYEKQSILSKITFIDLKNISSKLRYNHIPKIYKP